METMKFGLFILSVLSVKSALACTPVHACGAGTGDYGVARDMNLPWSAETLEGNYEI